MRALVRLGIAAAIVCSAGTPTTATAASIAFLSHTGSGSACSLAAPCASMSSAITAADVGGEVICLDKGIYGGATITSSITISCGDGLWEAPAATVGINTPTPSHVVVIEGLVSDGLTVSGPAVSFTNQGALHLHRVRIGNGSGANSNGLSFQPAGISRLFVTDSTFYNRGTFGIVAAINIRPVLAFVDVMIERTRIEDNNFGIIADGTGGGTIRGVVRDSVIARNANNGITVSSTGSSVVLSIDNCVISGNNFGLVASGANAGMLVGRSVISANSTGLSTSSSGVILSYRDNRLNANTPDGVFTGPVGLQ